MGGDDKPGRLAPPGGYGNRRAQRSASGSWALSGGQHGLLVVGQILGEVLPNSSRRELQESELIEPELLKGRGGIRVRKIECRLALLRCDRSNVDQADDLWIVPSFSNDDSSVRVSDKQDWTFTVSTSSASDVSGVWTETTLKPLAWRSGITFDQLEPSAHAPWTSMMLLTPRFWSFCCVAPVDVAVISSATATTVTDRPVNLERVIFIS